MGSKVYKRKRHLRWNWEHSPEDSEKVRYHFIVVDDKDREGKINILLEQLQEFGSVEEVRNDGGKVKDSKFRYLFISCDSTTAPRILNFNKLPRDYPIRRDKNLRERKRGNLSDVVADFYEN